jgi:hypothetical protein
MMKQLTIGKKGFYITITIAIAIFLLVTLLIEVSYGLSWVMSPIGVLYILYFLLLKREIYFDEEKVILGNQSSGEKIRMSEVESISQVADFYYIKLKNRKLLSSYIFFIPDYKFGLSKIFERKTPVNDSPIVELRKYVITTANNKGFMWSVRPSMKPKLNYIPDSMGIALSSFVLL